MTGEENGIMQQHVAYWMKYMQEGKILVFGPVIDPLAVYGIGIAVVESKEELDELLDKDPASKLNRYEYHPMKAVVVNSLVSNS